MQAHPNPDLVCKTESGPLASPARSLNLSVNLSRFPEAGRDSIGHAELSRKYLFHRVLRVDGRLIL